MKKIKHLLIPLLILLTTPLWTEEMKYPVLSLNYEGAYGSEEDIEIDELTPASFRNELTFKVVEEFSKALRLSFPVSYICKEYFTTTGNYSYIKLNPYLSYNLNKSHNLKLELTSKWMDYQEPDTKGISKDYFQWGGLLQYIFKPVTGTKLTTYIKGLYDLYDNLEKVQQNYAFRFNISTRLNQYTLSGTYRGTIRLPLGVESLKSLTSLNTFSLNLAWDPNRQ